ncbi:hypothetical protein NEUTE1DRAFT_103290 [Neurospora tetrasperma FGSC 2508]|uniref:Uncharacterized protein n=1 Tax=Neurospora tetrasperma (strain FGSC 2508 / ATCC MYA-4615 / P0657) TaxID=510951 RepID=F8MSF3_NEUT8|nr:uncharacterized protein NEUTE1DRAFT_103290 [Neurospora tetrasperma FGSC 2508]EGO55893.1 hypothetical protein NEUTE1DRAFT_103290 [Neurospora tetrasperma FGSC 2508]EGZ68850.1 hypothetical protein NEUTE2DRAFT_71480 [Neurospora tetrasperma FGSC 2509]
METDPDSNVSALHSQPSSDMADDQLDIESTLRSSQLKIKELRRELDAVDIVIDKLVTSYTALNKAWSEVDQKAGVTRVRESMEKDGEEGGHEQEGSEEGRDEAERKEEGEDGGDDDKKRKRKDSSETEDPTTTRSRRSSNSSSPPIDVSEATLDAVARILPLPLPQLEEDSKNNLEDGDMTEAATGGGGGGSSTSHQQQQKGNRKKIHMDKREVKRVRTVSPESGSGSGLGSGSELGSVMKSIEGDEVDGSQERDGQSLDSEGGYEQEELPDNGGEVNLRKDLQVNVVFLEQQFKRYEEDTYKRLEMYKGDMKRRVETLENDMNERVEKLERVVHKSIEKLENWMSWNEWVGETITYGGDDTDDEDEEEEDSEEDSEDDEDTEEHDDDDDDDDNDDNDDNYNGNLPSPPDDHTLTNSANH